MNNQHETKTESFFERNIFLAVLLGTLLLIGIGFLLPGGERQQTLYLPWQIEIQADGSSRVFGLTLGHSTLAEAESVFGPMTDVTLFAPQNSNAVVEAYFDNVTLSGFKAKIVAEIDVDADTTNAFFERGLRIARMGDGSRKVTLSVDDEIQVRQMAVASLTYLPGIDIETETLINRFGQPEQIIPEDNGTSEHWLYPDKGLDLVVNSEGKEVFQYVSPAEFSRLMVPFSASESTP